MAKMLNKIKTTAGLEAQYQTKKSKDDFKHDGEIDASVKLLKTIRAAGGLRHSFHGFIDKTKDANNAENNLGTAFNTAGGEHNIEHWSQLGSAFVDATIKRLQMIDAISKVQEEWKTFESSDIKKVMQLEDACNRALSDKEYYAKHDQSSLSGAEKTYQESGQKLIAATKELHDSSTRLFPAWTKRIIEAEAAYHVAASAVWQKAVQDVQ